MTGRVYFVSRWKAPNVAGTKHDVTEQLAAVGYVPASEVARARKEGYALGLREGITGKRPSEADFKAMGDSGPLSETGGQA